LELPLQKYKVFVKKVEASSLFKRVVEKEKKLSNGRTFSNKKYSKKVVAVISTNNKNFVIRYTDNVLNKIYIISGNSSRTCTQAGLKNTSYLAYKIKRINSRNLLTHRVLKGVIKQQRRYLKTGNISDLAPFSQTQLVKMLPGSVDISWISRLVNNLSVLTPFGEEKRLRTFFQTTKDVNKIYLKKLFEKKSSLTFNDAQIKDLLKNEFALSVSRRTVCYYRKELGIPSYKKRLSCDRYFAFVSVFSCVYPLLIETVIKHSPEKNGVYELLTEKEAFYIGSTKNIKKRLKEHLKHSNKNVKIKKILKSNNCFFRYCLFQENWRKKEKELYDCFLKRYKRAPECNRIKPGG